ncbi:protein GUCD1-like isoform X2 [Amphibalanus amphitrite]|uniref:protein GUCD1-like isoform X2 n=1 Tax=Amphibalanus amphitrite TaxID=1232801 RepID=UPI001C9149E4|nr:protein GUCD1-like isoform X2 [Amphibalanus amphitrite]XP_043245153.1 protein GUCD1-like isoform X2 [Amphibalanus amphitrite]
MFGIGWVQIARRDSGVNHCHKQKMPKTGPAPKRARLPADVPETAARPQVPAVQQRHRWDCGLACVMMVLPETKRRHFSDNFAAVCREEGFGKSTWTIDLVYLLHRYGVQLRYFTITPGIDPGYHRQSFYGYGKVLRMVDVRPVAAEEILRHLALHGPVIVLTDARFLRCDVCRANQAGSELSSCFPCASEYRGHYIVLYGYDLPKGVVFYRNPTFKDRECCMSLGALEKCRRSYGTDEDLIFVYDSWSS